MKQQLNTYDATLNQVIRKQNAIHTITLYAKIYYVIHTINIIEKNNTNAIRLKMKKIFIIVDETSQNVISMYRVNTQKKDLLGNEERIIQMAIRGKELKQMEAELAIQFVIV